MDSFSHPSSSNPFSSIAMPGQSEADSKQPLQGFVRFVCIFFIVLGAFGLMGTLQTVGSMAIAMLMDGKQFNPMTLFPGAMAISIGIAVLNGVVSILEIVGGVLGLKQKRSGANLIRLVSGFMLILKVAETAFAVTLQYLSIGPTVEQTLRQLPEEPAGGADIGMIVQVAMFAIMGLTIVVALVLFVFYLVSFLTFRKQKTLSQFS